MTNYLATMVTCCLGCAEACIILTKKSRPYDPASQLCNVPMRMKTHSTEDGSFQTNTSTLVLSLKSPSHLQLPPSHPHSISTFARILHLRETFKVVVPMLN